VSRLIVWRHGNTDWNATNRVQGQTDVPLNALGRQQAADTAPLLAAMRPAAIVASDLQRAADTAAALAALTGLPVSYDKRLRERFFGAWQGLTTSEVVERFPADYARWRAGEELNGDIETLHDLGSRVATAFEAAASLTPPGGTVVVATHGAAARQGIERLVGWPSGAGRTLRPLGNCHWVELVHDQRRGWQIETYNLGPLASAPV